MQFDWDPEKEKANIKKHGVSFDEATSVFYDTLSLTYPDPDHSIRESRNIIVGLSNKGRLLFVSHVDNGQRIRIITDVTQSQLHVAPMELLMFLFFWISINISPLWGYHPLNNAVGVECPAVRDAVKRHL